MTIDHSSAKRVKSFVITLFFLGFLGALFPIAPVPVEAAGLVPCGKSSGDASETAPCTVCHIIVGGNGLITWGLRIMTIIAITVLFAMAVLYVVSAGDQGLMQTAKGGIWAALIGFGVMLAAWLIVNIVLTILVDTNDANKPLGGLINNGAFQFSCDVSSNANRPRP